jgi:thioredoxin-related protein
MTNISKKLLSYYPDYLIGKIAYYGNVDFLEVYETKEERKKHFFDHVNFKESFLIRTNVLPELYMSYFYNYTEFSEKGFKSSVDDILSLTEPYDEVYTFSLNYLLDLFERVGPQYVFQHIIENYIVNESCANDAADSKYKNFAEKYQKTMLGRTLPSVSFFNVNDSLISLNDFILKSNQPYTMIVFWSSQCAYCLDAIKQIQEDSIDFKMNVIAISIDENKNNWLASVNDKQIQNWQNLNEPSSWKAESLTELNIYKTPSFFIVDRNSKIALKPNSAYQILQFIEKNNNFTD